MSKDDEQEFRHPSYAMIQVSRLTGGDTRPLFGSALDRNPTPFLLQSFQEAAQRAVQEAKQEVDAFMTRALQTAGLEALRSRADRDAERAWIAEFASPLSDPLHPTGRCVCAGEGQCDWCRRVGNTLDEDGRG